MPKPFQYPELDYQGSPRGEYELGSRDPGDPRRAIRFRVFPYVIPKRHVRLDLAPTYSVRVVVLEVAENGYALGEVQGSWKGNKYTSYDHDALSRTSDPAEATRLAIKLANYDRTRAAKLRGMSYYAFHHMMRKYGVLTLPVLRYHTDEEILNLGAACRWNKSHVARCIGVERFTLTLLLKQRGLMDAWLPMDKHTFRAVSRDVVVSMYEAGWSMRMIAAAFDVEYATVGRDMRAWGIQLRSRGGTRNVTTNQGYRWPKRTLAFDRCTPMNTKQAKDPAFSTIVELVEKRSAEMRA